MSIIGVAYTGSDRVRALSVYGIVLGLAAVGGVLVQADLGGLGWRSCFLSTCRSASRASRSPPGWWPSRAPS